jgi:hypothetical protein
MNNFCYKYNGFFLNKLCFCGGKFCAFFVEPPTPKRGVTSSVSYFLENDRLIFGKKG